MVSAGQAARSAPSAVPQIPRDGVRLAQVLRADTRGVGTGQVVLMLRRRALGAMDASVGFWRDQWLPVGVLFR